MKTIDILNINDPEFTQKFIQALGFKPGEVLEITGPQFEREDGVQPVMSIDNWEGLRSQSVESLKTIGCRPWSAPDDQGKSIMLFPAEWYDLIPEGFMVIDISGEWELFEHGVTDDDRRGGVLAYGVEVTRLAALGDL